jgi:hypothetical protein
MVPSKMGWGVAGGVLLVFLGCWSWDPYVDPDQQGDSNLTLSCPGCPLVVLLELGIHISPNNGPMDMIPSGKLIYYVPPIHFACSIM